MNKRCKGTALPGVPLPWGIHARSRQPPPRSPNSALKWHLGGPAKLHLHCACLRSPSNYPVSHWDLSPHLPSGPARSMWPAGRTATAAPHCTERCLCSPAALPLLPTPSPAPDAGPAPPINGAFSRRAQPKDRGGASPLSASPPKHWWATNPKGAVGKVCKESPK